MSGPSVNDRRVVGRPEPRRRARPPSRAVQDPAALLAVHEATRALLDADSPCEVVDIVLTLVAALGAEAIPAQVAGADALPWDLSFGVDEPLLPVAALMSVPRLHLETLLPSFLEDARRVCLLYTSDA